MESTIGVIGNICSISTVIAALVLLINGDKNRQIQLAKILNTILQTIVIVCPVYYFWVVMDNKISDEEAFSKITIFIFVAAIYFLFYLRWFQSFVSDAINLITATAKFREDLQSYWRILNENVIEMNEGFESDPKSIADLWNIISANLNLLANSYEGIDLTCMIEKADNQLHIVARSGNISPLTMANLTFDLTTGDSPYQDGVGVGTVAYLERNSIYSHDVRNIRYYKSDPSKVRQSHQSLFSIPLIHGGCVYGVLSITGARNSEMISESWRDHISLIITPLFARYIKFSLAQLKCGKINSDKRLVI